MISDDERFFERCLTDVPTFALWPTERRDALLATMARMTREEIGGVTVGFFVALLRAAAATGAVALEAVRGARDETLDELERLVRELRAAGGEIPPALQARLDALRAARDGRGDGATRN